VGIDIAGTWRAEGGDSCYWERSVVRTCRVDEIIANDVTTGPIVTIAASAGFSSQGCGTLPQRRRRLLSYV
jgi:hypothetical protein